MMERIKQIACEIVGPCPPFYYKGCLTRETIEELEGKPNTPENKDLIFALIEYRCPLVQTIRWEIRDALLTERITQN